MCTCSDMKNAVIGNNKQKANLIVLGAVPRSVSSVCSRPHCLCSSFKMVWRAVFVTCTHLHRLLYLLQQSSSSVELRIECSVVLGSLAMGTENNIKSLVDCQIIPALLQGFTVTHKPTHTHTCTYNLSCFCAHRSPVLRPGVHRSLPPMSENSFHQSSHTRAAAIYCRCSSCFTHNVWTDQFST